jgi:hypothetical protein
MLWLFLCIFLSFTHCIQRSCSIDLDTYNYDSATSNQSDLWLIGFYTERLENTSKFLEDWSNKGATYCIIEDQLPANTTAACPDCDNIKQFVSKDYKEEYRIRLGLVNMYSSIQT